MRDRLVNILESNPNTTFSTSELVERLHPEQYTDILNKKTNGSPEQQRNAQRQKAKLHRRVLYHLRKLQDTNNIAVVRRTTTGEKIYTYQQRTTPQPNPAAQTQPLRTQHAQTDNDWLATSHDAHADPSIDAILIDAAQHTPDELKHVTTTLTAITNDLIAITNTAEHLNDHGIQPLKDLIADINTAANKNGCQICLRLNPDRLPQQHIKSFTDTAYNTAGDNITTVHVTNYETTPNTTYETILAAAQRTRQQAHFESAPLTDKPVFIGQYGPYTVPHKTWERIHNHDVAPITCLCHTTFSIDTTAFFTNNSLTDLRNTITNTAKHSFLTTSKARNDIVLALNDHLNKHNEFYIDFLSTTQNYIRCWNPPRHDDNPSFQAYTTLLDTVNTTTNTLMQKQATIFQACGLPLNVTTTIAPAKPDATPPSFTDNASRQRILHGLSELNDDHWQTHLAKQEEQAGLYNQAHRLHINHAPTTNPASLVAEIHHLQRHRATPLICYDFQHQTKEPQLHDFL
jgi:hypothetical protein